ncbi:membrane hypothetical protein [Nitrolancea hollandica Lb]|uniref:Uncharacterized protein n=2 Tax=Nitrolancea hollandica TaxID=1206749 RepID=I4EJY4_9BACT|nr:membrane hypothetical protein [Nitrolancea hollandica Lb]
MNEVNEFENPIGRLIYWASWILARVGGFLAPQRHAPEQSEMVRNYDHYIIRLFTCPQKQQSFKATFELPGLLSTEAGDITVMGLVTGAHQPNHPRTSATWVAPLEHGENGLNEVGKTMLASNLTNIIDFSKTMITVSTVAITAYYLLFTFILPEKQVLDSLCDKVLVASPAFFFLIASMLFVYAYEPRRTLLALNNPERLRHERRATLARFRQITRVGFAMFVVATILAVVVVVWIGYSASRPAPYWWYAAASLPAVLL